MENSPNLSAKFTFRLTSNLRNHPLPAKILIAQQPVEPLDHVLLKLLAFVVFQRDRLQLQPRLHDDNVPYVPDLLQLDFTLRPVLWVDCGDVSVARLDKLAVKTPWAEIWAVTRSRQHLDVLAGEMTRLNLRRNRYRLLAFDGGMFEEMLRLLNERNELALYGASLETGELQLDFNGLWFEGTMAVERF